MLNFFEFDFYIQKKVYTKQTDLTTNSQLNSTQLSKMSQMKQVEINISKKNFMILQESADRNRRAEALSEFTAKKRDNGEPDKRTRAGKDFVEKWGADKIEVTRYLHPELYWIKKKKPFRLLYLLSIVLKKKNFEIYIQKKVYTKQTDLTTKMDLINNLNADIMGQIEIQVRGARIETKQRCLHAILQMEITLIPECIKYLGDFEIPPKNTYTMLESQYFPEFQKGVGLVDSLIDALEFEAPPLDPAELFYTGC